MGTRYSQWKHLLNDFEFWKKIEVKWKSWTLTVLCSSFLHIVNYNLEMLQHLRVDICSKKIILFIICWNICRKSCKLNVKNPLWISCSLCNWACFFWSLFSCHLLVCVMINNVETCFISWLSDEIHIWTEALKVMEGRNLELHT